MFEKIIKQLISNNSTPAYIFDEAKLRTRVAMVREILNEDADIKLCYAMKANPFLLKCLEGLVEKFEVCSPGELAICKKSNIDMKRVVFSGVNKEYTDVYRAFEYGVEIFTVESWKHLSVIEQCAAQQQKKVKVIIRLSADNQFGVDRNTIYRMAESRGQFGNVQMCGIHFYSGTQKKITKIVDELNQLAEFCCELKEKYMMEIEHLEYGPGLLVDYFAKGEDETAILQDFAKVIRDVSKQFPLTIEMGRFLTADCGSYVTKVIDTKQTNGQQYCIVDGGINHVNYYGQVMGVRIPPVRFYQQDGEAYREKELERKIDKNAGICVCGSLCTVADVLVRSMPLKEVKEGDIFVFDKIGAYSVTEGMYLFLSRRLPKVYLYKDGSLELLRYSYETYEWNC